MNPEAPLTSDQPPAQRVGVLAAVACLASILYVAWVGQSVLAWLPVQWLAWVIYLLLPLALTFTILYGSQVHSEMRRAARAFFLLGFSLLIYGGAWLALAAGALILLASFPLGRFH
jgi:hypothetical protein